MLNEYEVFKEWKLAVRYAQIGCNGKRVDHLFMAMSKYIGGADHEAEGQTEEELFDQKQRFLKRLQKATCETGNSG